MVLVFSIHNYIGTEYTLVWKNMHDDIDPAPSYEKKLFLVKLL